MRPIFTGPQASGFLLWKGNRWNDTEPNPIFDDLPEGALPVKKIYIKNGKLEVVYDNPEEGEEQEE